MTMAKIVCKNNFIYLVKRLEYIVSKTKNNIQDAKIVSDNLSEMI